MIGFDLDIVIPVYNEGENILPVLASLNSHVRSQSRVLICYDFDDDNTLEALKNYNGRIPVVYVKNPKRGPHSAVCAGFAAADASAVVVLPADDDYNAPIIEDMLAGIRAGSDIVCASRFVAGGTMKNCPWLKATLVRLSAFFLYHVARLPTHDASNGFRMFSRRLLARVPIESTIGFTYSIELLVKCHRLGWKITEVPAQWMERKSGRSRFQILKWVRPYLEWFFYAFETTYLRRPASTVTIRDA